MPNTRAVDLLGRSTTTPYHESTYHKWLAELIGAETLATTKLMSLLRRNESYDKTDLLSGHFTGDVLWLVAWLYTVSCWPNGKQQVLTYLGLEQPQSGPQSGPRSGRGATA